VRESAKGVGFGEWRREWENGRLRECKGLYADMHTHCYTLVMGSPKEVGVRKCKMDRMQRAVRWHARVLVYTWEGECIGIGRGKVERKGSASTRSRTGLHLSERIWECVVWYTHTPGALRWHARMLVYTLEGECEGSGSGRVERKGSALTCSCTSIHLHERMWERVVRYTHIYICIHI